MPTHSTLGEITRATKSIDALLHALDGNPGAGAAAAYRAALARHGRQLADTAGPDALDTVRARIRDEAPDQAAAQDRERVLAEAWADLLSVKDRAA